MAISLPYVNPGFEGTGCQSLVGVGRDEGDGLGDGGREDNDVCGGSRGGRRVEGRDVLRCGNQLTVRESMLRRDGMSITGGWPCLDVAFSPIW